MKRYLKIAATLITATCLFSCREEVDKNPFWETSHTVIYDLEAKKGYLIPFENYYSKDRNHLDPIEITLP